MKKLSFLILILFVVSCEKKEGQPHQQDKKIENYTTDYSKIVSDYKKNSINVIKNKDGFFRIWAESDDQNLSQYYISGEKSSINIGLYIFENNKAVLKKSKTIRELEWNYFSIDSAAQIVQKVQNKDFLFLSGSRGFMGTAVPEKSVEFLMFNINDISESYSLLYSGYYSALCDDCIKGDFIKDAKSKNKIARNELLEFAKKSKLIYQQKKSEKDIKNYKNFEEKWQQDNQQDSHFGAGNLGELSDIHSTYYKKNLFKISGGTPTEIENEIYTIVSYFKGNIIAYDKIKKMYFPIIVESCADFCDKKIEFVKPHIICVSYDENTSYNINLNAIIFE